MGNLAARDFISDLLRSSYRVVTVALVILFLMFSSTLQAQVSILKVEASATHVTIDPFNNLYLITSGNEYVKYDKTGKLVDAYSDLQLDAYSEISSDHPFKSMVYYPQYNLIRVFGNKLQVLAELNLSGAGFGEITAVAPTEGYQSFWIFDATSQKLVRISQNYDLIYEGSDLTPVLNEVVFPQKIKEREGWLYVYDIDKGLYIFDNFGAFSKKLNVIGASSFSIFKDRIYFTKEGQVYEVDPYTNTTLPIKLELEGEIMTMAFRQIILKKGNVIEVIRF
ncbi:MAG: hypothetical protein GY751_05765 [Bacteroidetes bacterium]|nr:hypothetical protein [Bacteroidota bacterium]